MLRPQRSLPVCQKFCPTITFSAICCTQESSTPMHKALTNYRIARISPSWTAYSCKWTQWRYVSVTTLPSPPMTTNASEGFSYLRQRSDLYMDLYMHNASLRWLPSDHSCRKELSQMPHDHSILQSLASDNTAWSSQYCTPGDVTDTLSIIIMIWVEVHISAGTVA